MVMRLDLADDDYAESHEINVTPFIDVMLVLLIIFIVAAPLSTVNVPLDLPVSSAQASPPPQEPLTLSIQKDLKLSLGDTPVSEDTLAAALAAHTHGDRSTVIFLRADKNVTYEHIMRLMDRLRGAGYLKVALVGLEGNG